MDRDELCFTPATELARMIRDRQVSPDEVADAVLERADEINPGLNAIVHLDEDQVRRDARTATEAVTRGDPLGPLHGVPYTIKDLTPVAGRPMTFGLRPMADVIPDYTAPIAERMAAAGGLLLGKTNTPEAGYCGRTTNHLFGPTRNPWDRTRTPGGSSGGAAAAVAAGLGPLAEGSDGGGSVRLPASFCGLVGVKPTTGRIPQTVMPSRSLTFPTHGPLTRTVADAALMLEVVSGPDARDPLSLPREERDWLPAAAERSSSLRVAWSEDLGGLIDVDPEIAAICRQAVDDLADHGWEVEEAHPDWSDLDPESAMWEGVWTPAYAGLAGMLPMDRLAGMVDDELIEVVAAGGALTGLQIAAADAMRGAIYDRFAVFMEGFELLVTPTVGVRPFEAEAFGPAHLDGEPLSRRLLGWMLTYPFNLTGTPAASVPCGFAGDGTPVGLQIATGFHADRLLLEALAGVEAALPWAHHRPPAD
jgi:Asp-tRNA(Asn)/Glu-tRNA(Gln) amidotransferase A subunit family amidase